MFKRITEQGSSHTLPQSSTGKRVSGSDHPVNLWLDQYQCVKNTLQSIVSKATVHWTVTSVFF